MGFLVPHVLPALERGEDRHVVGGKLVPARRENISHLSFVHEHGNLALPDDELRSVLDFIAISRELPYNGVAGIVHPFYDINKFAFYLVPESHIVSP